MDRPEQVGVRCGHCGKVIYGEDEEILAKELRRHNRDYHEIEMTEEEAQAFVKENSSPEVVSKS